MVDIFGNTLEVGDEVAFNRPRYTGLIKGKVTKITPKGVTILYKEGNRELSTNEAWYYVVKNLNFPKIP